MLAYDDLRGRSNQIRPLRWNRANSRVVDAQQKTSAVTVVPLAHASELLALSGWNGCVMHTRRAAAIGVFAFWIELEAIGIWPLREFRPENPVPGVWR
jgi:hypothetical protein